MRITDYTTRLSAAEGKILLFKSCHLSQSKIFVTYLVRGLPDVLGNFFLIINARSGVKCLVLLTVLIYLYNYVVCCVQLAQLTGVFRSVFCFDALVLCCHFVRYLNGGKYFTGALIIM